MHPISPYSNHPNTNDSSQMIRCMKMLNDYRLGAIINELVANLQ